MTRRAAVQLRAAILAVGVGVEQVGLADGVRVALVTDDRIQLLLGEEGTETFDDVAAACARIERYADDYGADRSKRGAIVELVGRLGQLVADLAPDKRALALVTDRYNDVEDIAAKLGFDVRYEIEEDDNMLTADDDGDIGFFEDGNDVRWHVYVEDGDVRYALAPSS